MGRSAPTDHPVGRKGGWHASAPAHAIWMIGA